MRLFIDFVVEFTNSDYRNICYTKILENKKGLTFKDSPSFVLL